MSHLPIVIISICLYVLAARAALSLSDARKRSLFFALVNITAFTWLTLCARYSQWVDEPIIGLGVSAVSTHVLLIAFYVLTTVFGYALLRVLARRGSWLPWIAFAYPILPLVAFRYFPFIWEPAIEQIAWQPWMIAATFIGLSYMAFRLSYLVIEVRNGAVEMPTLSEYLGFAFFLPTIVIGPISPYSLHHESLSVRDGARVPVGRCLMRILVGAAKFLFLANLANQLTYQGIFLDGKPHAVFDLGVAVVFYYLYLYLNFSGFCDMAIGLAGLIGIRVKENFDNPFVARNIKEFWNRWHITLSEYTRDVIFGPVSRSLMKNLGPRYANLSICIGIVCVFLTIGIWHGVGLMFAVFGLIHAAGVIANHYYTIWMKRLLGRDRYRAYNENGLVNAAAMLLTFFYVAGSFAIFANTYDGLGVIKNSLISAL